MWGLQEILQKYSVTVAQPRRSWPDYQDAFYIARTGRPGPVLIDLPKDVMSELESGEYPKAVNIRGYKPNTAVHIGQLKRAIKMLHTAKTGLSFAGGGINIAGAETFYKDCRKTQVPCRNNNYGRGAISTKHPLFMGEYRNARRLRGQTMAVSNCDLLFSIGTRFNDRITGKLHEFKPKCPDHPY